MLAGVFRLLVLCVLVTGVTRAQPADDAGGWNFEDDVEVQPTLLDLAREQAPDIVLFLAFATLAMVSFLRKSVPLKYVTLVASVLYMGVYKSQLISVVNIFGTLTGNLPLFAHSMAWYAFAIFTVVTTVLWGRVYCGRICAFGAFTQLIDAVVPKRFQLEVPQWLEQRASYIKYGILFGAVGYYLVTRRDRVLPLHRAVLDVHASTRHRCCGRCSACCSSRASSCAICIAGSCARSVPRSACCRTSRCSRSSAGPSAASAGSARRRANGARSANARSSNRNACAATTARSCTRISRRCPHWLLELKRKARALGLGR